MNAFSIAKIKAAAARISRSERVTIAKLAAEVGCSDPGRLERYINKVEGLKLEIKLQSVSSGNQAVRRGRCDPHAAARCIAAYETVHAIAQMCDREKLSAWLRVRYRRREGTEEQFVKEVLRPIAA